MSTTEFRVRPVIRHIVTRYTGDGKLGSVETLGEFENEGYAEQVAAALRDMAKRQEPNAYESRFALGDRVVSYGIEQVVKSIKFTPGKILYGLALITNPDGEEIEAPSEHVYPRGERR